MENTKTKNPFIKIGGWFKETGKWLFDFKDWKKLLRSVPAVSIALFVAATIGMNLMANKIIFSSKFCAADGGLLLSWIPFLCMDIVTRRYGPKAAIKLNIFALFTNLLFVGLFSAVSALHIGIGAVDVVNPGYMTWASYWEQFTSFDSVFSCTWFVLLGSSVAFLASGIINNIVNWSIGLMFKKNPDGKVAFFTRSYVSTFVGQFLDNFLFASIVFMFFAPIYWGYSLTLIQCLGSACVGAVLELIMELIFSPIGYKIYKKWEEEDVGKEYLEHRKQYEK